MVAAHPDKSFGQLGKLLGAAWTDADEDTKATYRKLHQEEKEQLIIEHPELAPKKPGPKPKAKKGGKHKPAHRVEDDEDGSDGVEQDEAILDSDLEDFDDDKARMECDWATHPAEAILAHTFDNKFLVKRKGLGFHDYGVVDARAAKRQRLQLPGQPAAPGAAGTTDGDEAPSPVGLAMVEAYESFVHDFKRARVEREDAQGGLDLSDLEEDCPLEMCNYLGKLQEQGGLLSKAIKKRGEEDALIKVPAMGLSLVVQRAVWIEREARLVAEARAAAAEAALVAAGHELPTLPLSALESPHVAGGTIVTGKNINQPSAETMAAIAAEA